MEWEEHLFKEVRYMTSLIIQFQMILFNRLRAKTPIDTGNMLANIIYGQSGDKATISISAPMASREGMTHKYTNSKAKKKSDVGKVVKAGKSNYDYAKKVNYEAKSPHRFWVETQIKEASHIVISNANYGLYK